MLYVSLSYLHTSNMKLESECEGTNTCALPGEPIYLVFPPTKQFDEFPSWLHRMRYLGPYRCAPAAFPAWRRAPRSLYSDPAVIAVNSSQRQSRLDKAELKCSSEASGEGQQGNAAITVRWLATDESVVFTEIQIAYHLPLLTRRILLNCCIAIVALNDSGLLSSVEE